MIHLKRFLIGFGFIAACFMCIVVMASLPDMVSAIPLIGEGIVVIVIGVICYIFGYGMTT